MEQTFIIGPELQNWVNLKSLLLSNKFNDLVSANELVEKLNFSEMEKDIIIDHLNMIDKNWHFFLENCEIKRVRAHTEEVSNEKNRIILGM